MKVHRTPRVEMHAAHRAYRAQRAMPAPAHVLTANMETVLDLGTTAFVTFRGRAFGVPPVAWRTGQRLLTLRMDAVAASNDGTLSPETAPRFYQVIGELAEVLWAHTRPVGRWRRIAKRLGLLRNPFAHATEKEIVELTNLFLRRRMLSTIGIPATVNPSAA